MRLTGFIFSVFLLTLSYGQTKSYVHLKTREIIVRKSEIQIDTFSIQPYYFEVFDAGKQLISKENYRIDFEKAILYLNDFDKLKGKKITVKYLVYPAYLRRSYQRYNPAVLQEKDTLQDIGYEMVNQPETKVFDGLKTKGSITRGVNAGNNQSLVMQSGLDLKIEGKISKNLQVKAVLSDDNLPQAYAGISQSYKEFDRIYMQLSAPKWQITGGDLILDEKENYFLKFARKTQGITYKNKREKAQIQITGGYVEGQFAINRFNGIDGNQGPYSLKGKQGETYIFVIPNSEKVFINGKRLKKGSDKDYTINYETAEIRFNATFPIHRNHRIVIEFNYANQHYIRYLNFNRYRHQGKQTSWSVYSFIESDVKSQTLLYDLTKEQVEQMRNTNGETQEIWVESAVETAYNENKILYKKIPVNNGYYYEFTTENLPELYEVKFTYKGKNKGDYQIQKVVANGKIYEYAGTNQGDYVPLIKLTPPKRKSYIGFDYVYKPNEQTNYYITGLINRFESNLFSNKSDFTPGGAVHTGIKQQLWQKDEKNFSAYLQYDFVNRNFSPLDIYRPVEFNRQWQIDSIFGKQHLIVSGVNWQNKYLFADAGWRYFQLRDSLKAQQTFFQADYHRNNWKANSDFRYTTQRYSADLQASYLHQQISYDWKKYRLTANGHFENRNKNQAKILDSLNYRYAFASFRFVKKDTSRFAYELFYRKEQNDSIYGNQWKKATLSDDFGIKISEKNKNHKLSFFLQYRILQPAKQDRLNHLNLKINWQQYLLKRFISTQIKVESFNGNTRQDEVVFVETPPGQGTHQWNDYNGNGIAEINEFEIAVYSDQAKYIRVVLPSKNYVPTLNNDYSAQIGFNPEVWKKKSILKHIFAVFRFENRFEILKDQTDFPLIWNAQESLSQQNIWQQDWFINRAKKKYFLHFNYQFVKQKQLMLIGKQEQVLEKYQLDTRHAFVNYLIWKQKFLCSSNTNRSENYQQKNFKLQKREWSEGLEWKQQQNRSFYLYFQYKQKENLQGNENLEMYQTGIRYFRLIKKKNLLNLDLQFIRNKMQGDTNSPVAFQMLEGLQNGKNLVFKSLFKQQLTSYLDLYLNYSFRISETHPVIHTGGIQLKMIF